MRYMLDTNVCIDYMRGADPGIIERIKKCQNDDICISSITLSELLYGVNRSSNPQQNRSSLYKLLIKAEVLDYGSEASEYYGLIRNDLTSKGQVIGSNDMLIAAHALSANLVLITNNTSEFSRIQDLKLEDWHK